MNLEQLSIGKMAKLNHISEQTLRLYDKIGLLTPQGLNESNGYRYYTIGQSAQLDLIRYYQKIGFSLKDIQNKLMSPDIDHLNHQLTLRMNQLEKEIETLQNCRTSIQKTLANYHYYESLPKNGIAFVEHLPASCAVVYDTGENMYDYDYNHYEYNLRQFKNYLEDIQFDWPLFGNVGTIVRQKDLMKHHLVSTEVFIVTDSQKITYPRTELFPEGSYLSLCCTDFTKEESYANSLLHQARTLGLAIDGDYYCEVLSEFPDFTAKRRLFYYKIRVEVK